MSHEAFKTPGDEQREKDVARWIKTLNRLYCGDAREQIVSALRVEVPMHVPADWEELEKLVRATYQQKLDAVPDGMTIMRNLIKNTLTNRSPDTEAQPLEPLQDRKDSAHQRAAKSASKKRRRRG